MNRIILIGNGFDRSLNIPTSYSHFLDWLINRTLENLFKNLPKNVSGLHHFKISDEIFEITTNCTTAIAIKKLNLHNLGYKKLLDEIKRLQNQREFELKLYPKHDFIDKLFEFYNKNSWVNVEELYFEELLTSTEESIEKLNECLELIKSKLVKYLNGLSNANNNKDTFSHYRNHFFGQKIKYETAYQSYEDSKESPNFYYFVNFKYTPFLRDLLEHAPFELLDQTIINNIHGEINNFPIIFGYGNETGKEYLKLEGLSDDFLENIKSTHYFNSTHYRDLETQLNEPYEVYIYGLSCGLSDHVLLKTILQKSNCKQIRIFYKKSEDGRDNFRNIFMNISRTFEDKENMRNKIISKQVEDCIPQINIK